MFWNFGHEIFEPLEFEFSFATERQVVVQKLVLAETAILSPPKIYVSAAFTKSTKNFRRALSWIMCGNLCGTKAGPKALAKLSQKNHPIVFVK